MSESKKKNKDSEESNSIAYRVDSKPAPVTDKKSGPRSICSQCKFSTHQTFKDDGGAIYRRNYWCLAEWNGRHPTTGRRRKVSDNRAVLIGAERCHTRNKNGECSFYSPTFWTRLLRRIGLR